MFDPLDGRRLIPTGVAATAAWVIPFSMVKPQISILSDVGRALLPGLSVLDKTCIRNDEN